MRCTHCSELVKPVVAFDIDNTLGDWTHHFIRFLSNYLNIPPHIQAVWCRYDGSGELSDWLELDKRSYQAAKLAFRQGGYKRSMPTFPHADIILKTARNLGAEVWITTTRPWMSLDNMDPDTREWLLRHDMIYDHLLFGEDKYLDLIERVDKDRIAMVLEDELPNVHRAWSLQLPVVMRRTKWNRGVQWIGEQCTTLAQAQVIMRDHISKWRLQNE